MLDRFRISIEEDLKLLYNYHVLPRTAIGAFWRYLVVTYALAWALGIQPSHLSLVGELLMLLVLFLVVAGIFYGGMYAGGLHTARVVERHVSDETFEEIFDPESIDRSA